LDEWSSEGKMNFRPFNLNVGGVKKRPTARRRRLPFVAAEGSE
jgi:hypothetical protein